MNIQALMKPWISCGLCALLCVSCSPRLTTLQEKKLAEICSADDSFTWLSPNDRAGYYMFSADHTNELRYFDESRDQEVTIPLPAPLGNTIAWSPSQRYLAVQVRESTFHDYPGAKAARKTWVMVYDAVRKSVRRVSTGDLVIESDAIWINDSQLVYLSRSLEEPGTVAARWAFDPEGGSLQRCESVPGFRKLPELLDPANTIVRLMDNTVLVVREDQVSTLDIVEPKLTRWADWLRGKADGLEWIRPDSAGREVLFCARSADSTNRNVFRVSMESGSLQRLTDEHSYNGKWIEGGRGFAYVGNTNNCFYLAVRPAATNAATNLFTSGWVRSYWPNPAGTAIYAEASLDAGPCGLWKYELATQQLRQLRPGNKLPLTHARVVVPQMKRYRSFDGLEIPTYFFSATNGVNPRTAPTVIAIPPPTDQCNRYYQPRPQFLPNLGFNYVGINYRGCDGYGLTYSALYDEDKAARDILTIVHSMLDAGEIPKNSLFLVCQSGGGGVFRRVLELEPDLWKGGVAAKASMGGLPQLDERQSKPPILFVIGDSDPILASVQRDIEKCREIGWPYEFYLIKDFTHLNIDPFGQRNQERRIVSAAK